jgi:hypothetical protein
MVFMAAGSEMRLDLVACYSLHVSSVKLLVVEAYFEQCVYPLEACQTLLWIATCGGFGAG